MSENTALATTAGTFALIPKGFEDAERIATKLSQSQMLPEHFRGKPENVFWALAYGLEVGLTPIQALQAIYVVHGRPGMYAAAKVALIRGSGVCEFFRCVEASATSATYETKRKGDPVVHKKQVTIEMARSAGWAGQNKKYESEPQRMLEARAKGWLADDVYPDVLRGIETAEELYDGGAGGPTFTAPPPSKGDIIDIAEAKVPRGPEPKGKPAPAAEKAAEPAPPAEKGPTADETEARRLALRMVEAKTVEELDEHMPAAAAIVKKLGNKHPDAIELKRVHKEHKALLEKGAA